MQLTPEQKTKIKKVAKLVDFESKGAVSLLEDIFELGDMYDKDIPELRELIEELKKERPDREEIREIISELIGDIKIPESIKGDKGDDGESYILTKNDKKEIASLIDVPVVEKIIEKTEVIREQPIEIIKEVAIIDKTDLTKEGEAIRDGLELLQDDERLDKKAIKGLDDYDEVARLAKTAGTRPFPVGGNRDLQQVTDMGATTTNAVSILNTLKVKQATTNAVIIGDVSGNARGDGALDLQSSRTSLTKVASGTSSVAVGINNTSSGANSFTSGYNNTASSNYCVASGYSNTASGYNSTALGVSNYVAGNYSSSLGYANNTSQYFSNAVGIANSASGYQSAAFGYSNTASANYTSAFGFVNNATETYSVALGAFAQATAFASLAIGSGTASGAYSSDLRTKATGINSVSVGTNSGYYGAGNTASGNYSSAFGIANSAFGNNSTAVGYGNSAFGNNSTAVGYGNSVSLTGSLVFGLDISNTTASTVEIGTSNAGKIQLSSTYLRPFTDNQKTLGGITNRWTTIYGSGGLMLGYTAKTANYTLTATDYLVNCTANTFTITLPTALAITGQIFIIKNSGTGIITLATTSSQTIDGVASGIFTLVQWDSITVTSNGANWIITN